MYASKSVANQGVTLRAQLIETSGSYTNVLKDSGVFTMPAVSTLSVFPLETLLTANTTVGSTNYIGVRIYGGRNGNANTVLIYGGTTYPSSLQFPVVNVSVTDDDSAYLTTNNLTRDVTFTNITITGVAKIILPTSTNGLTTGMLWNDTGIIRIKP